MAQEKKKVKIALIAGGDNFRSIILSIKVVVLKNKR
jgi:hypothetical protein